MTEALAKPQLPSKTFCVLPWLQLYSDTRGRLRPCCMSNGDRELDRDGNPYVVYDPRGIDEAWNSPFRKDMRLAMMSGQRPAVCHQCFTREDLGMRSYRQSANDMLVHHVADIVKRTTENGEAPTELIRKIEFYLGNSCNLRCRMCSPLASKALIKEWTGLRGMTASDPRLKALRRLDWPEGPDYWRTIEKILPHAERLHFAGGEPFLIPRTYEILERIVELGNAGNITLSFSTNLTTPPRRLLELWPRFKRVHVRGSLDGVGVVNGFIRHPARWRDVDRNLKQLDSGFTRLGIHDLATNTAVQVFNIFHIDEIVEYTATSFQNLGRPELSLLHEPAPFSIRILPPNMKQQAAARLRNVTRRLAGRWPARWQGGALTELLAQIDGIIEHMMSADWSDLIPEFRRWCQHQDRFRNQNTLDVLPELAPLFDLSAANQPIRKSA